MDARRWFDTAATGFLQVVDGINRADLGDPALGVWDVRSLLGHASRVRWLVEEAEDDRLIENPFGTMTLAAYLPTRAFEITVHGVDLARATRQAVPQALIETLVPAAELCAAMATPQQRIDLVLAITGRDP